MYKTSLKPVFPYQFYASPEVVRNLVGKLVTDERLYGSSFSVTVEKDPNEWTLWLSAASADYLVGQDELQLDFYLRARRPDDNRTQPYEAIPSVGTDPVTELERGRWK